MYWKFGRNRLLLVIDLQDLSLRFFEVKND